VQAADQCFDFRSDLKCECDSTATYNERKPKCATSSTYYQLGCCVEYDKIEKERADVQRAEAALARKKAALKQSIHMSNQYRLPAKATSTVKGTIEKAGWNKRMQRAKKGTRLAQMNAIAAKPVEDSWQEVQ